MREFTTAAARGKPGVVNAVDIRFKLDEDELTAHPPTTGQIALYVQHGAEGGMRSITSLLEFLGAVLDDDDWAIVEGHLAEGIDVGLLAQIANFLIGEWSGRPTTPPSVSSPTRNGTGRKSTVKPRAAAGRTSSRSRSTASATRSSGG